MFKTALIFIFSIIIIWPFDAHAIDVFKIDDVEVDITAENAVNAREKAFIQARRLAFEKLAERLLTSEEQKSIPQANDTEIGSLIENFEIIKEDLAPKQYRGKFSFTFKKEAAKRFFEGSGYRYSDVTGKAVIILPYYQVDGSSTLWGGDNPWLNAWQRVDTYSEGLVPVIVPLGDAQDIKDTPAYMPLEYNQDALLEMADRYSAQGVIIALASFNEQASEIHLYDTSGYRPEHIKTFSFDGPEINDQVLRDQARDVYAYLQNNWKKATAISNSAQQASLTLNAPISGLADWVLIKNALDKVSAISGYETVSLKPGNAEVKINFAGSYNRLQHALAQENLTIEQPQLNGYYDASGQYQNYQAAGSRPILKFR